MSLLARVIADTTQRLVDFTAAGYSVQREGTSLGTIVDKPVFAQTVDGSGVRVTGASREAREQQLRVLVTGATSAELQQRLDAMLQVADDVTRRGGGTLLYRSEDAPGVAVTRYRIVKAALAEAVNLADYEAFKRAIVTFAMVVEPLGLAWPLDWVDEFDTDTFGVGGLRNLGGADWTVSGGATIANGRVTTATPAVPVEMLRAQEDAFRDQQVTLEFVKSNGMQLRTGFYRDALNYVSAMINGTNLDIEVLNAGAASGPTTSISITNGVRYWLVVRREGASVFAELWSAAPTPMGTPLYSIGGPPSQGLPGGSFRTWVRWTPINAGGSLESVRREAFTYRSRLVPDVLRLGGRVPGSTAALASIEYTNGAATPPRSMLYAWWRKPPVHNYIDRGSAEIYAAGAPTVANGWDAGGRTGIVSACTSVARQTSNVHSGVGAYEAVCPATNTSGAVLTIARRGGFRRGVAYTVEAWVRSWSGTTPVYVRVGVDGSDRSAALGTNLSTSWQRITATWTPTADYDLAHVGIGLLAATATTFQFDDVMVYEGTTPPVTSLGGYGPGIIPAYANLATFWPSSGGFSSSANAGALVGGTVVVASGASINAAGYLPLLSHLFDPDEFSGGAVDLAVFARLFIPSTQTGLRCTISLHSEISDTTLSGARYGSAKSAGRVITRPSSGTVARLVYLGTIRMSVDPATPRREWLRVALSSAASASGDVGLDYVAVVPARRVARSRSGVAEAAVPAFHAGLSTESTKRVSSDLSGALRTPTRGWFPHDGLIGSNRITFDASEETELLALPSTTVVDRTDVDTATMTREHTATVHVGVQPRVHLLNQS